MSRFESWFRQLPIMEPEPIHIASQCLSFMIYKDGDSNSMYPLELF